METIKENRIFRMLYKKGKKKVTDSVVLYYMPFKHLNMVGFTVSKKIGKAVVRNKIRRRLKEIYRKYEVGTDKNMILVFVARTNSVNVTFSELEQSVLKLLKGSGLLKNEDNTD